MIFGNFLEILPPIFDIASTQSEIRYIRHILLYLLVFKIMNAVDLCGVLLNFQINKNGVEYVDALLVA